MREAADELIENEVRNGCQCIQCQECKGHGHIHTLTFRNSQGVEFFSEMPCESCEGSGLKHECDICREERERDLA